MTALDPTMVSISREPDGRWYVTLAVHGDAPEPLEEAGHAPLYSVVPSSAYVAGLYVESDLVSAAVADVGGRRVAEVSGNPSRVDDRVELVRGTVERACASAGIEVTRLSALVIGSPGVVNPRIGDPGLAVNLPAWHEGALDALKNWASASAGHHPGRPAAPRHGRGRGRDRLPPRARRPLHTDIRHPASGGFQSLAGGSAVRELAARHGFVAPTPAEAIQAALSGADRANGLEGVDGSEAFLSELAHRVAVGVAPVCVVLDPGLIVLGGEVGRAGGTVLADRVAAVASIWPSPRAWCQPECPASRCCAARC